MLSGTFDNIQQTKKADNILKAKKKKNGRLRFNSATESFAYEHSTHVVHYMFTYIYIVFKSYATILHFSTFLKDDK